MTKFSLFEGARSRKVSNYFTIFLSDVITQFFHFFSQNISDILKMDL